jgi:hypothetical protein
MHDLFDDTSRRSILERLDRVEPASQRQWGKMDAAQMMCHCAVALEAATGDKPRQHSLMGKLLGWMVRKKILGDAPFSRNSPTDPTFVISDARDFAREKTRLVVLIQRFVDLGPDAAGAQVHSFFGRLSGPEWGRLMGKHLDHHLQQFGV